MSIHGSGVGTADGAIDQLVGQGIDTLQIAEVGLDAEEVHTLHGLLPPVLEALHVGPGAQLVGERRHFDECAEVGAQAGDGEAGFEGGASADDQDEVFVGGR